MSQTLRLLGLACLLLPTALTLASDEEKKPGNPVFASRYADPESVIFGDMYWIYPTYPAPYDKRVFFDGFSSKDLVTWEKHPRILDSGSVSWARRAM